MEKILELDERFATGEPTVVMLATSDYGKWFVEKTASESANEYVRNITPRPGKTIILVNALGAYETYDDNRNGDAFPARPFRVGEATRCGHKGCNPNSNGWIEEPETLIHHYKTFEQFGGIYKHHQNKDAQKSMGKVERSFWHERMQRVELIEELDNAKAKEIVKRIQDGEFPAVSMGCHVRYDVCSICGHRAPTRKEYCEHARFQMRQINKVTGEKVCVLNPSPRFFDISFVFRPADPTGFMLKKVAEVSEIWSSSAELGEKIAAHEAKKAQVRKLGDIEKEIAGGPVMVAKSSPDGEMVRKYRDNVMRDVVKEMPSVDEKVLDKMSAFSLSQVASTLAAKNASLSTGEFIRLFMKKACRSVPSKEAVDRLVAMQPLFREVIAQYPDVEEKLSHLMQVEDRYVSPELAAKLGTWLEKRSGMLDYLRQKVHQPGMLGLGGSPLGPGYLYNASEPPKTDLFTMTDPNTGRVYQTTRGAAMEAHNTDQRSALAGAGLLGGLYTLGLWKGLGVHPLLSAAAGLPAGYATSRHLMRAVSPYRNPEYLTDQGQRVSGGTEFTKVSAFRITSLLNKIATDYAERVGLQECLSDALRREMSHHSPKLAAWLYDGQPMAEKAAGLVGDCALPPLHSADVPGVNLSMLISKLSQLVGS